MEAIKPGQKRAGCLADPFDYLDHLGIRDFIAGDQQDAGKGIEAVVFDHQEPRLSSATRVVLRMQADR